ncbi:L-galactose dehydrogenase-like [Penaeus monodon]|uniref:L-galactose dehydrogenase-like n=1 Tax=Penaeus monodon TaxID=6687 RepID=UPI0018A7D123|nr:L-galactose dehydrogenase-like [Penaeus monodon]XP_037795325.1 L-galactose dehydrogenase-like [Penaeus monodon]
MDQPTFVEGFHDPESVKKMTYHPLGNTGMQVSRLSLGGGPIGGLYGNTLETECVNMIHSALKSGVNYIDTAPWYGNGRSEEVLGKALKDVPRSAYYIGTKVGRYEPCVERMFDFSGDRVARSVDHSLELLGLDYVDVIQVHDLEFAESVDLIVNETLPALQKVVEQGKARHIGITGYPLSLLKEVVERSSVKIEVVLSYARNTLIDDVLKEYLPFFQSRNIGVISACAVAMGLLCEGEPPEWHPAQQEIKDASKLAAKFCKDAGSDLARLAVQFSASTEGVATHLMGCNDSRIFRRNLEAILTPPTAHEIALSQQVREKFFQTLSRREWEGASVAEYWEELKKLQTGKS